MASRASADVALAQIAPQGVLSRAGRAVLLFARRKPLAAGGAFVLIVLLTASLLAPVLAPGDPYTGDITRGLEDPSSAHLFGTDDLGRDVLSRVLYGGRYSLFIGVGAVAIAITIAAAVGLVSAYGGSRVDLPAQRVVDAVMAIPFLLLLLSFMSVLGAGISNVTLVVGIFLGITYSRVVRSAVFVVLAEPYIEASRVLGAGHGRIIVRHILPNVAAPLMVLASLGLGTAILAESSLSFLGYGVPPPEPTWGQMIGLQARPYIVSAPWLAIAPGAAITIAVFSINVLGDGLRDVLDPRQRGYWQAVKR